MSETVIMYDSDEAAREITPGEAVKIMAAKGRRLWLAKGSIYTDEYMARYEGCTHRACADCGQPTEKYYAICYACRQRSISVRYEAMPSIEWKDCSLPVYSGELDEYFFDEDELRDALVSKSLTSTTARLVECIPSPKPMLDDDFFSDALPEDHTLADVVSRKVLDAIDALNAAVEAEPAWAFLPGKRRVNADILLRDKEEA